MNYLPSADTWALPAQSRALPLLRQVWNPISLSHVPLTRLVLTLRSLHGSLIYSQVTWLLVQLFPEELVRFTQYFLRMMLAKMPQDRGPVFPYKNKKPGLLLGRLGQASFQGIISSKRRKLMLTCSGKVSMLTILAGFYNIHKSKLSL